MVPWWLIPVLVLAPYLAGVMQGWIWGWNRGKLIGDRAHEACHEAQRIVLDEISAQVKEHRDLQAWEEEL